MFDQGHRDTWEDLLRTPRRRDSLALDLYFRDCWVDANEILGSEAPVALNRHALLIFKPESVVGRRMTIAIDWLTKRHFTPVASAPVTHSRHTMIDLWKYSRWSANMPDWIQLASLMHTSTRTLLVILRDERPELGADACSRLVQLKGSAIRAHRDGSHLREVLQPTGEIFNFVHSSDEPADLIREVGICLDRAERRQLLKRIASAPHPRLALLEIRSQIADLERESAKHDFDFEQSLRRAAVRCQLEHLERLRLEAASNGGPKMRWDELRAILDPASIDTWDFIVIGCAVMDL